MFGDEKSKNKIYAFVGFVGSVASAISLVVSLEGYWKLSGIIVFLIFAVGIHAIKEEAKEKEARFKLNNTGVSVYIGDIFSPVENEISVIPVNEYYDTQVDDVIVAKKTLHGMYIERYWKDKVEELNGLISNDIVLSKSLIEVNKSRKLGKQQKYNIGSVVRINQFVLTAMTHFDNDNKAYLQYSEYIEFLFSFWSNIDEIYANSDINIPVFGSGITRINGKVPSMQQLIETILWSLNESEFHGKKVNLIIYKDDAEQVDFYHLEPKIY